MSAAGPSALVGGTAPGPGSVRGLPVLRTASVLVLALVGGCAEGLRGNEAPTAATWQMLGAVDWTVAAGRERFICGITTVSDDVFVRRLEPIGSPGSHHVLATLAVGGEDGSFDCTAGTLSDSLLFASGVNSGPLELPEGVAMAVPAGTRVLTNAHVLNLTNAPLSGTSGVRAETVPADDVLVEAEMILAGTTRFSLPAHMESSASGRCRFREDATVTHLWPHMHLLGVHMRVTHHGRDGARILLDTPFQFDAQGHHRVGPVEVLAGDSLEVTCTWNNGSGQVVGFGDSTLDEMCFAGVVRFPAAHEGLYCEEIPSP